MDQWFPFILLGGMIVLFYVLLIRPQNKRRKEHAQMTSALSIGDEVILASGIVGEIVSLADQFVYIKVADNVSFPVQRASVQATLPRGTLKGIPDQ